MKKIIVILVSILFIACNQEAQSQGQSSIAEVIEKADFIEKMSNSEDYILIDVRTKGEFNNGSISGSQNFDFLNGSFQEKIKSLDKTKPVFLYCAVGGRSGKARKLLESEGFQIVYDLKGGYTNWTKNQ